MTQDEIKQATQAATQFVEHDIPALDSGNMRPWVTIRYADHPLTRLSRVGDGWSPSPNDVDPDNPYQAPAAPAALSQDATASASKRTLPPFDSVMVIWD